MVMISQSYRAAMSRWVGSAERAYGTRLNGLRSALSSGMPDEDIEKMAMDVKSAYERSVTARPDKSMNIHAKQFANGVVYFMDQGTGYLHARLVPYRDGFAYVGPESLISHLFGRAALSQVKMDLHGSQKDLNWLDDAKTGK